MLRLGALYDRTTEEELDVPLLVPFPATQFVAIPDPVACESDLAVVALTSPRPFALGNRLTGSPGQRLSGNGVD